MHEVNGNSAIIRQFTAFLDAHSLRKTDERYAILNKIMEETKPFSVDALYADLKADDFYVSKATVYNTVGLLVEAKIIGRLIMPLGNQVMYERISQMECCHVVCTECGKVKLVKDSNFEAYMNARKFPSFNTSHYALYVYGLCNTCTRKLKRRASEAGNKGNKRKL